MREIDTVFDLHQGILEARRAGKTVGFVPTMGFLHEGHLSLAAQARAETDVVVMSIFVNPTQFGPQDDFDRYPRDLSRDRRLAEAAGVSVLFVPGMDQVYPGGPEAQQVWIDPGPLASHLEGASRPGHFRGVATVVAKLFHMVQPDRAYFGQKDAQQALVVARMVEDLGFPLEVRICPTVREADGLARSSRNVYLSPQERAEAPALWRCLERARALIEAGERDAGRIEAAMRDCIAALAPHARLDYAAIADLKTLRPVTGTIKGDALIAVAAHLGKTRLIDNVILRFAGGKPTFS